MTLDDLQTLIGKLTNDPNHDRYSLVDINTELDNSQDIWNLDAKVLKDSVTITVVDGTRQYALSGLTGTPIAFPRTTHKGIDLIKRSKAYFDHLTNYDWTQDTGTPTDFFIEAEDPDNQFITLHPTPQSGDAGAYLVVEYVKRQTSMSLSTDVPFMSGTTSNYLLRPFDMGLAYSVAAKLLMRDPTQENALKSTNYATIAKNVLAEVIQVFNALEAEEPKRISGGRYWAGGNVRQLK